MKKPFSWFLLLVLGPFLHVDGQLPALTPNKSNPWNGTWQLDVKRSSAVAVEEGVHQVYRFTLAPAGPAVVNIQWEIPELGEIVKGKTDGSPMIIHRFGATPGLTLTVRTEGTNVLLYQVLRYGKPYGAGRMMLVDGGKAWIDLTWPAGRQDLASELTYVKQSLLEQGSSTIDQLRLIDEQLNKALSAQNSATWASYTAPDLVYVTEGGQILTRTELLSALNAEPGARGASVPDSEIRDYTVFTQNDSATVVYHLFETGEYLGSPLKGFDVVTETWQRTNGQWKLRIAHVTPVPVAPPAVTLPHSEIDSLVGTYRAGTATLLIRRDGDHILSSQNGGPETEKLAEAVDVLFSSNLPRLRMIFQRNPVTGDVTGFASRNENRSIYFKRVSPAAP